ncbi:MAG: hypothetical protein GWO24_15605 [Akkermansiaceae bacterium]|nr:hypothetical protein [Akkermansiaceae bacterium]
MGRVIGTALVTLCLEAHYRYTPLYGLGWDPDENGPTGASMNQDQLPETPLYRHARHLAVLSSPAEDTSPVVTDHGDFLYFASSRDGGLGGSDLYRSRVSGPEPGAPQNLGPEINSGNNETNPAVRNAGFQLLFNSDRADNAGGLYSARSKRVVRRYDYSKMPSLGWLASNFGWLVALGGALTGCLWLSWRALAAGRATARPEPGPRKAPPDAAT